MCRNGCSPRLYKDLFCPQEGTSRVTAVLLVPEIIPSSQSVGELANQVGVLPPSETAS